MKIHKRGKFLFLKLSTAVARTLFTFFIPGGLVLLIAILLHQGLLVETLSGPVRVYPYVVLIAGILFGLLFRRSQLVFVTLVLALADRSLLYFAFGDAASTGMGRNVYNAVALLLPLNLFLFSIMKERGIVSKSGIRRLSLILLQVFGVALIFRFLKMNVNFYLEYSFIEWTWLSRIPMAQPLLCVFGVAFLILMVRYIRYYGAVECSFVWALVSSFFALTLDRIGPVSTTYLATAGLILVISVIETSYSRAFRDALTGLPARRALDETLYKLGSSYTVAMVDIDHFKNFNDRYGHHVGDEVLRMIASRLTKITGGGRPYRYGGEEFTVIFPGKSVDEAILHLEALRKEIEESGFFLRMGNRPLKKPKYPKTVKGSKNKVLITISIGVAERSDRHSKPQQIVKAADKALYRAKRGGRNRISD